MTNTSELTPMLEGLARLLATSSRDWGQYAPDAWLYAVICGWDCEETEHDETCTHGAMEEMAERHGWDEATVAKARRYRAAVRAVVEPPADQTTPSHRAALSDRIADAVQPLLMDTLPKAIAAAQAREITAAVLAVLAVLPAPADRATVLRDAADVAERVAIKRHEQHEIEREQGAYDVMTVLRRMADESPLSPYYEHPECGFHWHGRDGMDIPMQDGQPVCPRCELAKVQKQLRYTQKMREEVGAESRRRGKIKLEQAEKIARLERQLDEVRTQLGAEILRAGQAEAELRRMADETATTQTPPERVKHSGPDSKFCVLCLSGEHERVDDEPAAGARQDGSQP